MIWWFVILGLSTLVVVCVAIALYMRVRRHLQASDATTRTDNVRRDGGAGDS